MAHPLDFDKLVSDISKSRQFLQETAELMTGENRKNFDTLLDGIDIHFKKMKVEVPKCEQMLADKFAELEKRHEQNVVDLAAAKEKYEQVLAQMAENEQPRSEAPPETPVDVQLGEKLRIELLNRFASDTPIAPLADDVAWQNWSLQGNWNKT